MRSQTVTVADHTRSMQKIPDCMDHAPFRRELVTAGAQPSVDHQPLVDASSPRARCAKLTRKRSIQSRGEVVGMIPTQRLSKVRAGPKT